MDKFANREVCDLTFVDYKTKIPFLMVDYANTAATEVTGETVYAYGGQGHPKRVSFSGDKGGTISFETQIQTMKLYSLMTGGAIEKTATFIKREVVKCETDKTLNLSVEPVIGTVNVFADNDDCGTPIEVEVSGTSVTATTGITTGKEYIAYYIENISTGVQKISIKSTTFPKAFTAYGETYDKTTNDEILPYKMIAYKCVPQNQFKLDFSNSGDPATLTVTCDLMADDDNNMLDLILMEEAE